MRCVAICVLWPACTKGPEADPGIYRETALYSSTNVSCSATGTPTTLTMSFYNEIAVEAGPKVAFVSCTAPTMCAPIAPTDWFQPDGDHWTNASAQLVPLSGSLQACVLTYDTLAMHRSGSTVHLDFLRRTGAGDVNACTLDHAIALASDPLCEDVDRYELAM
jgi:hypothetical protein